MAWPRLVKHTVTCPSCGSSVTVEAIHQPHQRVRDSRDRIYESRTWADCPSCGHEWELRQSDDAHTAVRTRRIYVCHPFADDPQANVEQVRELCRVLTDGGYLPIAPHLYLPQFLDEETERDRALTLCLELVGACDEVRVYGGRVTAGMRLELERAESLSIPVRFVEEAQ